MDDISNYEKLREDAQSFYNDIGTIFCPLFKEKVYFNSEGFNHIVYNNPRSERERSSQIMRFKLLPLVCELIKITTTFQEFEESVKEVVVKSHKKKIKKSKAVKYWGIIAIIKGRKIKVILRKIGNGSIHFWSIVPAWTTNKHRDIKFITTMKGNPEED